MGENNTYVDIELIKTKKIVVATPIYGTEVELKHFLSILQLNTFAIQNNLNIHYIYKNGDALIARVRNDLVDIFLEMDGDYLFFIDSDISFSVNSFLNTVTMAIKNNQDITTAAYPQKSIHWDKIKKADNLGLIKSEKDYEEFSGHYGINFFNKKIVNLLEPQEILDGSTGFMLINKNVFYEIKKIFPEQSNITYEGNETFAYFDCKIDEKTKVYLSEDYTFCRFAQKANMKVWLLPWINLDHIGSYTYKGSFTQFSILNSMI